MIGGGELARRCQSETDCCSGRGRRWVPDVGGPGDPGTGDRAHGRGEAGADRGEARADAQLRLVHAPMLVGARPASPAMSHNLRTVVARGPPCSTASGFLRVIDYGCQIQTSRICSVVSRS